MRYIAILVTLTAIVSLNVEANAFAKDAPMAEEIDEVPPITTVGEFPASDPKFAEECLSKAEAMAATTHWKLIRTSLTRSVVYGLVWRADFKIPIGEDAGITQYDDSVNRIMIWKLKDGRLGKFYGANLQTPSLANVSGSPVA